LKLIHRNIGNENTVAHAAAVAFEERRGSRLQGKIVHGGKIMPAKKKAAKKKKH
jgi:hypothetical protein